MTAGHRSTARQSGASGAAGADTLDGDLAPPSRGGATLVTITTTYIFTLYIHLKISNIHANCAKLLFKKPMFGKTS